MFRTHVPGFKEVLALHLFLPSLDCKEVVGQRLGPTGARAGPFWGWAHVHICQGTPGGGGTTRSSCALSTCATRARWGRKQRSQRLWQTYSLTYYLRYLKIADLIIFFQRSNTIITTFKGKYISAIISVFYEILKGYTFIFCLYFFLHFWALLTICYSDCNL